MLISHLALITIGGKCNLKVIKYFLLNSHFISTFLCYYFLCIYLHVNLRAQGSKVFIEAFFTSQWGTRIEYIKWFAIYLITTSNHLCLHRHFCLFLCWALNRRVSIIFQFALSNLKIVWIVIFARD